MIRLDLGIAFELPVRSGKRFHDLKNAELEMPPFLHEFVQPIALLPTVQSMLHFLSFCRGVCLLVSCAAWASPKFLLKRIEHLGCADH